DVAIRGRQLASRRLESARLGPFPGDLQGHAVVALGGGGDSAGRVREGALPSLVRLDDVVRALEPPMRRQLLQDGVVREHLTESLPVSLVEGLDLLTGEIGL